MKVTALFKNWCLKNAFVELEPGDVHDLMRLCHALIDWGDDQTMWSAARRAGSGWIRAGQELWAARSTRSESTATPCSSLAKHLAFEKLSVLFETSPKK